MHWRASIMRERKVGHMLLFMGEGVMGLALKKVSLKSGAAAKVFNHIREPRAFCAILKWNAVPHFIKNVRSIKYGSAAVPSGEQWVTVLLPTWTKLFVLFFTTWTAKLHMPMFLSKGLKQFYDNPLSISMSEQSSTSRKVWRRDGILGQ